MKLPIAKIAAGMLAATFGIASPGYSFSNVICHLSPVGAPGVSAPKTLKASFSIDLNNPDFSEYECSTFKECQDLGQTEAYWNRQSICAKAGRNKCYFPAIWSRDVIIENYPYKGEFQMYLDGPINLENGVSYSGSYTVRVNIRENKLFGFTLASSRTSEVYNEFSDIDFNLAVSANREFVSFYCSSN